MDGVDRELDPGKPLNNVNLYQVSDKEREEWGIDFLPSSLEEALRFLEEDEVIKNALTPHILDYYLKAKREEWKEYKNTVHPWEIERYLELY
jgi:glutamine synthetase